MEKLEIYLTFEDAVRLEQAKAEQGELDVHYTEMTVDEYASILLHHMLNPDRELDEL